MSAALVVLWGVTGCTPDTETGKDSPAPVEDRGPWISVSAGERVSCGVHADHSIECWGDNEPQPGENSDKDTGWVNHHEDEPPDIEASEVIVSAGAWDDNDGNAACAVTTDEDVICWGGIAAPAEAPAGVSAPIALGDMWGCGVDAGGSAECWHSYEDLNSSWTGSVSSVRALHGHYQTLCIQDAAETMQCGIVYFEDPFSTQPGPNTVLAVGVTYFGGGWCALDDAGVISCTNATGDTSFEDAYAVPNDLGPFTDLCASGGWGCALDTDGHPHCFGVHDYTGDFSIPDPDIALTSLSCGNAHACGLTPDGDVACWGNDDYSQASPPGEHVATGL